MGMIIVLSFGVKVSPSREEDITMDDEELRMAFDVLDSDSNGLIASKEVKDVFQVFNIKEKDTKIEKMVRKADIHGNGGIDFNQFKYIMKKCRKKVDGPQRYQKIFHLIDHDNAGTINSEKLKDYMR